MVRFILKKTNKKGLSEMLSYVLLIFIVVGLWSLVYVFIRANANVEAPIDCKQDTSITLEKTECYDNIVKLIIKNNGRFNISGIIVSVGDNYQNIPTDYLAPFSIDGEIMKGQKGIYYFIKSLAPGESSAAIFSNRKVNADGGDNLMELITVIQLQAFVQYKKNKILCKESVIKQEIENCYFGE